MRRGALASLAALSGALTLTAAWGVASCGPREYSPASAAQGAGGAQQWKRLPGATLTRSEVGAARIGDVAYIVGGFAPPGLTTAVAEEVDLRSARRSRIAPMPIALNHPAAASWRGRLYVVGGYADRQRLTAESAALLRYDPRSRRWTRLADMPTPRGALTAGVVGDRLIAAGGARGGAALRTVEIYDLRSGRWRAPPRRCASRASTSPARSSAVASTCWPGVPPVRATSGWPSVCVRT